MKLYRVFFVILFLATTNIVAQSDKYRAEREKVNNLVHTKLDLKFDIFNSLLLGEAWITITPHFKDVNEVALDAKGMQIHSVKVNGQKTSYNYFENRELIIALDKTYSKDEQYLVYVNYTAQPEKAVKLGVASSKGLHFIDPTGEDEEVPTQLWSENEPESASVWFPTIDAPNQKSSQEISITVPSDYETLSNGVLTSVKENEDETRTDTWKQELAHAPYLFFIGAGDFEIVKDTDWKGKEISYYVEKGQEQYAKAVFGKTDDMLQFYEDKLGVEYPWDKYNQIVVREYTSGAMENTSAVIHSDAAYQDDRELIDENSWENVIAHEVIHHWFGDLVTAESWSNLPLNEAFAEYGEYLWFEHEYGRDFADDFLRKEKRAYLRSKRSKEKDLIRFKFNSADDMFDVVSYQKGGLIMHMLRDYLGDEAFFEGLKKYLEDNKYQSAEAHQLRIAFEKVSGKDLNWFFNQWFFGNAHPEILVTKTLGAFNDQITVNIGQSGKMFEFPLDIDVYQESGKTRHTVWVDAQQKSFSFPLDSKLLLVDVNPEGVLLGEIVHQKSIKEMVYQYNNANSYKSRREAIEFLADNQTDDLAFKTLTKAMNDKFFKLRILAIEKLDLSNKYAKKRAIQVVEKLAKNDPKTLVRAAANTTLAKLVDPVYMNHFLQALDNKSYKVVESAIVGLYQIDKGRALQEIDKLTVKEKDKMARLLTGYFLENRQDKYMDFIAKNLVRGLFYSQDKKVADAYMDAFNWISSSNNEVAVKNLVKDFVRIGLKYKSYGSDVAALNFLRKMVDIQRGSENANKKDLEVIIRGGMANFVD